MGIFRKKSNPKKNKEAIDAFNLYNTLSASTRKNYLYSIERFAEFLVINRKSLWDVSAENVKKFLLQEGDAKDATAISTFYQVLIDAGEYVGDNPVLSMRNAEELDAVDGKPEPQPISHVESILLDLAPEDARQKELEIGVVKKRKRQKKHPKPIMTIADLDILVKKTTHIRERALIEVLFATGARLSEIVGLNVSDIDLENRKIMFFETNQIVSRALAIPKRTLAFLKLYERWRSRQLSASNAYFITKTTMERISESTISTWLYRIQRKTEPSKRWTAADFRKRAILQHYWLTRDLIAVTRFAGFKRPETTLKMINAVLIDRGIESLEEITKLPEFEGLETDRKKISPTLDNSTSITINLAPDELEMIRKSGLTPTQAVRTIFSLKDLYGAVAPSSGVATSIAPKSSSPPSSSSQGGPSMGGPSLSGGGSGPPLASGPSLSAKPSGGPGLSKKPDANPTVPRKPIAKPPPRQPMAPSGGGGGQAGFLGELKARLEARQKAVADGAPTIQPKDHFAAKIIDSNLATDVADDSPSEKTDDDDEKDQPSTGGPSLG